MANSLNRVFLLGNVTRDPEVKFTPKGSAVTDVGIALNRAYTNSSGEKVEEVVYVDVELWGRTAEIAGEYAKKGRQILIEGRLRMDSWEDKATGQKRSRLRVVGENLTLLGGGARAGAPGRSDDEVGESRSAVPGARSKASDSPPSPPEPDDIPF